MVNQPGLYLKPPTNPPLSLLHLPHPAHQDRGSTVAMEIGTSEDEKPTFLFYFFFFFFSFFLCTRINVAEETWVLPKWNPCQNLGWCSRATRQNSCKVCSSALPLFFFVFLSRDVTVQLFWTYFPPGAPPTWWHKVVSETDSVRFSISITVCV